MQPYVCHTTRFYIQFLFILLCVFLPARSLLAQGVEITFNVRMQYYIEQDLFDPENEFVDLAGNFNGWGSELIKLSDPDVDSVYTVTIGGFVEGEEIAFKFRINGEWQGRDEFTGGKSNRIYRVQSSDNEITLWYNYEELPIGPAMSNLGVADQAIDVGDGVRFVNESGGIVTDHDWRFESIMVSTPGALSNLSPKLHSTRVDEFGLGGKTGVQRGRFAVVTTAIAASYTGIFFFEKSRWWDGPGSKFHFGSHLNYARNIDKVAHFYAGDVQALTITRALEWSGVPHKKAALWGAITSLAAQTHTEIHDGLNPAWGFDWYDQAANAIGAAWFYAHERVPALQRFDFRWSYYPSNAWLDNLEERRKQGRMFADDYSGHAYWLSMRVYDLLPGVMGQIWPEALDVSFGASLHNWTDEVWNDPDSYMAYYISLDINWRKIIPRDSWFGRSSGDLLNRFHLPFPAIRVWPEPGFHLVFVGQE